MQMIKLMTVNYKNDLDHFLLKSFRKDAMHTALLCIGK